MRLYRSNNWKASRNRSLFYSTYSLRRIPVSALRVRLNF
jgi:hypothetical protein